MASSLPQEQAPAEVFHESIKSVTFADDDEPPAKGTFVSRRRVIMPNQEEPVRDHSISLEQAVNNPDALASLTNPKTPGEKHRLGLVIINIVTSFFFVGATLGWGPMQLLLEDNGAFASQCTEEEQKLEVVCPEQTSMLMSIGLMVPAVRIFSPVLGVLVDHVGAPEFAYCQAAFAVVGLSFVKLATSFDIDIFLFIGFFLAAVHAWMGSLLVVQLGLYFERHTITRVIFIVSSFFDAGAITTILLWGVQQWTGASTNSIIAVYLACAIVVYTISVYFWATAVPQGDIEEKKKIAPTTRYSRFELLSNAHDMRRAMKARISNWEQLDASTLNYLQSNEFPTPGDDFAKTNLNTGRASTVSRKSKRISSYVPVADRSAKDQLTSIPFLALCVFFAFNVCQSNWNLMSQRDFLASLGDDDYDNRYLMIFTLMTPVSILGGPLIDWTILTLGWPAALFTINGLAVAFQVVKLITDNLNIQIVGFVIYSFYRSFLFGISFSFLPSLMGHEVAGKAAGIMSGFAGIMNLGLLGFVQMAMSTDGGDFTVPNLIILSAGVPVATAAVFVIRQYIILEALVKEQGQG